MQCLILKALGYSYEEIAARTGFSWTKVNRSLTEGRRRFFERFGEIAAGTACRRYQPLLSVACDGLAGADDQRLLKAHLASCSGCRAALREYRSAPVRIAELLPPAIVLPLLDRASLWSRINDWFAVTAGERATAVGVKLQQGAEVVGAQKAAAVVASTAAIAGGGAAVHDADRPGRDPTPRAQAAIGAPAAPSAEPPHASLPAAAEPAGDRAGEAPAASGDDDPAQPRQAEFGFEGDPGTGSGGVPQPDPGGEVPAARSASREFTSAGSGAGTSPGGGGEFGP
jgi:hypothetical protein